MNYDKIITSIVDYYIKTIEDSYKRTVPPSVTFSPYVCEDTELVNVYVTTKSDVAGVRNIRFFCTYKCIPDCHYFGKIPFKLYKTLEEELDTALSEYRRMAFTKLSHRQRHVEGTTG